MDYNLKYATGNVIRFKGRNSMEIICDVHSDVVITLSFNHSRSKSYYSYDSKMKKKSCPHCDHWGEDEECEDCGGKGHIMVKDVGMDESIKVADSVGDFIKQRLNNIFYNFNDE